MNSPTISDVEREARELHCYACGQKFPTACKCHRPDFSLVELRSALSAQKSEREEWQDISAAPHACHVLAARWDECEWVMAVVASPPSKPFTHWRPLPAPPAIRNLKIEVDDAG